MCNQYSCNHVHEEWFETINFAEYAKTSKRSYEIGILLVLSNEHSNTNWTNMFPKAMSFQTHKAQHKKENYQKSAYVKSEIKL